MNKVLSKFVFIKYFFILSILVTFFNCNSPVLENNNSFGTNYGKIDDSNLELKFGDVILFKDSNINAIVIDILNEDGEYFFGLSFMNNDLIFGRRIPEGFNGNCIDLIDVSYISTKSLTNRFKIMKHENLNFDIVDIGSYRYFDRYEEILTSYNEEINKRKLTQTPCDNLTELNPIHEQYFNINQFR